VHHHDTEFAKILTGRHGEQLDTLIAAVDAADLIAKVTDAVNEELAAWPNWPLDRICPVQARSGGRLCPARTSSGTAPVMRDPATRHVECPAKLAGRWRRGAAASAQRLGGHARTPAGADALAAPWPAGNSCDATKWCAALNIDSLSENLNTGGQLNPTCAAVTGLEYVNFAFITKNGVSQAPANPVDATLATFTPDPAKDLFMSSGDTLTVALGDTSSGFRVVIRDLTSGATGSMTASAANGFGEVSTPRRRRPAAPTSPPTSTRCTRPQARPPGFHGRPTRTTWPSPTRSGTSSTATGSTRRRSAATTRA